MLSEFLFNENIFTILVLWKLKIHYFEKVDGREIQLTRVTIYEWTTRILRELLVTKKKTYTEDLMFKSF